MERKRRIIKAYSYWSQKSPKRPLPLGGRIDRAYASGTYVWCQEQVESDQLFCKFCCSGWWPAGDRQISCANLHSSSAPGLSLDVTSPIRKPSHQLNHLQPDHHQPVLCCSQVCMPIGKPREIYREVAPTNIKRN